jgi:hypothetical protein
MDEYVTLVMGATNKLKFVSNFQSVADVTATGFLAKETARRLVSLQRMVGKPGWFRGMTKDERAANPVVTEELAQKYAAIHAEEEVPGTLGIHHAAVIVFAHAVFEALTHELFTLDFRCNGAQWDAKLSKRCIEYGVAAKLRKPNLREKVWLKERWDIEHRKKLQENLNDLLCRCQERNQPEYLKLRKAYKVDTSQVQKLDQLRQSLIHKPPIPAPIGNLDDLLKSILEMSALIAHCCGVCLYDLPITDIGFGVVGFRSPVPSNPPTPVAG